MRPSSYDSYHEYKLQEEASLIAKGSTAVLQAPLISSNKRTVKARYRIRHIGLAGGNFRSSVFVHDKAKSLIFPLPLTKYALNAFDSFRLAWLVICQVILPSAILATGRYPNLAATPSQQKVNKHYKSISLEVKGTQCVRSRKAPPDMHIISPSPLPWAKK